MLWLAMVLIMALHSSAAQESNSEEEFKFYEYNKNPQIAVSEESCDVLKEEFRREYTEHSVRLALLWNDTVEHAAAALLRATLMSVGYNEDLIELYKQDSMDPSNLNRHTLKVEMPTKSDLLLQVRLTPGSALLEVCKIFAKYYWIYSYNRPLPQMLHVCDFQLSVPNSPKGTTIYVVKKWENTRFAQQIKLIPPTAGLQILYVERSYLKNLVRGSNYSFFFLDTYEPNQSVEGFPVAFGVIAGIKDFNNTTDSDPATGDKTVLLKYAAGNNVGEEVSKKYINIDPNLWELGGVLFEYNLSNKSNSDDDNMKIAACKWMCMFKFFPNRFSKWQQSVALISENASVAVAICKTEAQDLKEYLDTMEVFGDHKNYTVSSFIGNKPGIQTFFIDCEKNINLFLIELIDWLGNKTKYVTQISTAEVKENSTYVKSAIVTSDVALAATQFESKLKMPLFIYDVYYGPQTQWFNLEINGLRLYSATGTVEYFIVALKRLLASCAWQRLAVISEPTRLAVAVSAALTDFPEPLTVRDRKINTISDIPSTLQELLDANARVILVNTGAATAASILAAAQKRDMTRDKGFVWILREYNAADHATSVTRPYSLSFWWRGERMNEISKRGEPKNKLDNCSEANHENMIDEMAIRLELEEKWRGRAWPLHAAPLLDALFMAHQYSIDKIPFWLGGKENITGINQHLSFINDGITTPLIYLEQWGTEPRPDLLATWRSGEWPSSPDACPAIDRPSDGLYCFLPSDDSFQPTCLEFVWITAILTTLIGTAIVIAVIYWSFKALKAYGRRIKYNYAKQILVRQERMFEALADHIVDRTALQVLQELGSGRFGRVHQGLLRESVGNRQTITVAVKTLKEDATSAEESEFLREACTLATLEHENIIRFKGVCVVDGPPLLLMEHAFFGDLLQYLQARRCLAERTSNTETINSFETDEQTHVSAKSITKLAREAVTALAYLSQRGIVHRDVRASNCLVDERRCLKLADFGLARAPETADGEYQMCRRGFLPVLWMAPESLAQGLFSPASDVWSFGVLLFELVTLGRRPYGAQPPPAVLRHVVAGGQPQVPWDANAETRAIMRACWRREPDARPTAACLAHWLSVRWRALRPALVAELVDIDKLTNDLNEPDLCPV